MGASAALDTDPEKLKAMFDVNVVGPLRMVQGFAPALAKSAKSGSRAKVLNIGTVLSGGAPWHTGYASSKVSHLQILMRV
jgi:NAD(P)-dependent dehydrogenase (short-subunit alcohol dehydrogenase family)